MARLGADGFQWAVCDNPAYGPAMIGDAKRTIGVEEEYLLVDRESRDLVNDPPASLMADCEAQLEGRVSPELLRSQIEIGTHVCDNVQQAREQLATLRRTIAEVADSHGLAPIAVSTHPFARWQDQQPTDRQRYQDIAKELELVGRRALICGMHVHVGVDDEDLRIELMNQVRYFLPHLLVLSTSSPFWEGEDTGLMCYRLSVFHNLPRTGMPERFESYGEFDRMVSNLASVGVLQDGTKLWWDVRPSVRFPTLELRIADMCTRLDDAITIAALYQSVLRMLWRLRKGNQRWRIYPHLLMEENRWRAQRYGTDGDLIDFGQWTMESFPSLLDQMIDYIREDAEELGCLAEVEHAREITSRGTSAHTQRHVYGAALAAGADETEALRAVVDWLIDETVRGLEPRGAAARQTG